MIYDKKLLNNVQSESYVSNKVERRVIQDRGYGLFAKEFISKNEIISVSGGIIIDKNYNKHLLEQDLDYAYHITDNLLICPLNPIYPSDDWRMNHCCNANCGLDGNTVFVAMRDIEKDEELTYDYCMTESNPDYEVELTCDKDNCRKVFTGRDWENKVLQDKYKNYFSSYIKRKINHTN